MPFNWRDDGSVRVARASPVHASVAVPGSKSLTNRWLLLAALAEGESQLCKPLHSEDTQLMVEVLRACGVLIQQHDTHWAVSGTGRLRQPDHNLYVGNAGTVMRFMTPALAAHPISVVLAGSQRMALRPIEDLADGLESMGVKIGYLEQPGFPPIRVTGPIINTQVALRGDRSSQYLSGVLMALPILGGGSVTVTSSLVSQTYVDMTCACMAAMGVTVDVDNPGRAYRVPGGSYGGRTIEVEGDASSASYWFGLPLMLGAGAVTVVNARLDSHQGDIGLLRVLGEMGADIQHDGNGVRVGAQPLRGVDVDMTSMSDVAPTLMAIATRASSPTTIRGIGHIRIKECDRIATMQTAFDQLGLKMESGPDWVKVFPGRASHAGRLDPQDDHRMAMCFALLGLADGGVTIENARCVEKTYPSFFDDMSKALV